MQRELLEVERLAREALEEIDGIVLDCEQVCEDSDVCGETVEGLVECPKCQTQVPFKQKCDGKFEHEAACCGALTISEAASPKFRELRLALVALDLVRSRENAA